MPLLPNLANELRLVGKPFGMKAMGDRHDFGDGSINA